MGLFTNVGGELKEPSILFTNIGGQLKELNSLYTNVGGELKEIYTMFPENIYGTWHKTTGVSSMSNRDVICEKLKINVPVICKMTLTITDGYVFDEDESNPDDRYQLHEAYIQVYRGSNEIMHVGTLDKNGSNRWTCYDLVYTNTKKIAPDNDNPYITIKCNRWVSTGYGPGSTGVSGSEYFTGTFFNNDLLSFDYSIEFTKA